MSKLLICLVLMYFLDKLSFVMQLAEKSLFEDVEVLHQMKELIAELGPGILLFNCYTNVPCALRNDIGLCSFIKCSVLWLETTLVFTCFMQS